MDNKIIPEAASPESEGRSVSRREAVWSGGGNLAAALAALAIPAVLVRPREAYANHLPPEVVDVLNFALTLEYLEAEFYTRGVGSGVIPQRDRSLFVTIRDHEVAHVAFLQDVLRTAAVEKPTFDFSVGGLAPFRDYDTFKLLAQGFEDAGVRAYKGQVGVLQPYDAILTAAVTIHSVEARHAAAVRRLRGIQGWIPADGSDTPLPPIYAGEGNTVIGGLDVTTLPLSQFGITTEQITESFDEPLTRQQVLDVAGTFVVS